MSIASKLKNILINIKLRPLIYNEELRDAYLTPSVTGSSLIGKNVLITGGSGGIGVALALRFLFEGANVCISGRSEEKLKSTQSYIMKKIPNANIRYIVMDQLRCECIKEGVDLLYGGGFPIEILINNSGIFTDVDKKRMFRRVKEEEFFLVWNTCFEGTKFLSEYVGDKMNEIIGSGSIIVISSICADFRNYQYTPYGMSKIAIKKYSQLLDKKYENINVKVIQPGTVATKMNVRSFGDNIASLNNTLHHAALPEEIAALAAFLASETGSYIKSEGIRASACEVL